MTEVARELDKVPVLDDPRPKFSTLFLVPDISETSVESAWSLLRPMAEARGFRNLKIMEAELWVSGTCDVIGARIAEHFGMSLHVVPAPMLKTNFTWLLKFGQDAVLSTPLD